MKLTIAALFIIIATFSGMPQVRQNKYEEIVEPLKIQNDSLEAKYYREINKTDPLIDKLIAKSKRQQENNVILLADIKRLKRINEFLKQHIDTVYIRDTVFKKRKILQIFKN